MEDATLKARPLVIARGSIRHEIGPPIAAAPMAGALDPPYRMLLHELGIPLSYTEMVSARGICMASERTNEYVRWRPDKGLSGIQLFGNDPEHLSKAAGIMENDGYQIIDLNTGCPKRKVVSQGYGGALIRHPDRLLKALSSILDTVKVPVGTKTRSSYGHFDGPAFLRLIKDIEGSGASYIAIHPRSVVQGFRGKAEREHIRMASGAVDIPVIASGDVRGPSDVLDYLTRGASCVMAGRSLLGDPTWFGRCIGSLKGADWGKYPASVRDIDEHLSLAVVHLENAISFYGEVRGCREIRPQISWYLSSFKGRSAFRDRLFSLRTRQEVLEFIGNVRESWTKSL